MDIIYIEGGHVINFNYAMTMKTMCKYVIITLAGVLFYACNAEDDILQENDNSLANNLIASLETKVSMSLDAAMELLVTKQWELIQVKEEGDSVISAIGNRLTLNSDYTMTFDCSANSGQTYDHTWVGGMISPTDYGAVDSMSWSISSSAGKTYITVTNGYLLVFAQESMSGVYEIKELTDSTLTVDILTYDETWSLLFESVEDTSEVITNHYSHTFANGDFGIGPPFDWGGWIDGYYYDMLSSSDDLSGAVWSITDAGFFEWAGTEAESETYYGIQLGTGGMTVSSFELSTSSFPGIITKVTIGYNSSITDNESLSVSCTVGGSNFGTPISHGVNDYEAIFEGSASGDIEISISSTVNGAIYLYYVEVEYLTDASVSESTNVNGYTPTGYSLVWNDEFDNSNSLSNKWYFEYGGSGWGNNELQYYCANGVYTPTGQQTALVSDGTLKIKAYKISPSASSDNCSYISTRMNTNASWQYGYIEMRAKLPLTPGCWPAFWMLLQNGPSYVRDESGTGGEIDMLEYVPGEDANTIHFSAHSYNATREAGVNTGYVDPVTGVKYPYSDNTSIVGAGNWHCYGMEWTHEYIRGYLDGVEYFYAPNPTPNVSDPATWPFDQRYYIKLNLAIGGSWGGTPAANFTEETYEIDWVRVYQK